MTGGLGYIQRDQVMHDLSDTLKFFRLLIVLLKREQNSKCKIQSSTGPLHRGLVNGQFLRADITIPATLLIIAERKFHFHLLLLLHSQ